jgi:signal transduction histidine kinase
MIQGVVEVLHEHETGPRFLMPVAELTEAVLADTKGLANGKAVRFTLEDRSAGASLDSRTAGIVRLILSNLVQNAIQASPEGSVVTLRAGATGSQVRFEVADQGNGVPESVRSRLFQPMRSTRDGGTGLGLAISRQLALHLGAELRLARTSDHGSSFELQLPPASR